MSNVTSSIALSRRRAPIYATRMGNHVWRIVYCKPQLEKFRVRIAPYYFLIHGFGTAEYYRNRPQ